MRTGLSSRGRMEDRIPVGERERRNEVIDPLASASIFNVAYASEGVPVVSHTRGEGK